jgi:hypothetical protein
VLTTLELEKELEIRFKKQASNTSLIYFQVGLRIRLIKLDTIRPEILNILKQVPIFKVEDIRMLKSFKQDQNLTQIVNRVAVLRNRLETDLSI